MLLSTPPEMAADAAKRFRHLRKAKGITIKSLSESSGVPYSTIRRFESTGEVSFVALIKMASVMGEDRQIEALFEESVPASIEEVIRGNRE
jgi:transcriptional regulator with XRE-family HTH domain